MSMANDWKCIQITCITLYPVAYHTMGNLLRPGKGRMLNGKFGGLSGKFGEGFN